MTATLEMGPPAAPLTRAGSAGTSHAAGDGADRAGNGARAGAVRRAFLARLAEDGVSPASATRYERHLGRFDAWLARRSQAGLLLAVSSDARAYRGHLMTVQRPASINAALTVLKRFYRWAVEAGYVPADPTRRVKPVAQQPMSPKAFSNVERRRLQQEAQRSGPMPEAIVTTLLGTGARLAELCALEWRDVALGARSGEATIRTGKGGKRRVVALHVEVRAALAAIRPASAQDATGPIFRGKRGPYSPRGVRELLAVLGRRAGVADVYPHRFRHDFARRLVAGGVDLPIVAGLLGHSDLRHMLRYAQPSGDDMQRAVERLEEGA